MNLLIQLERRLQIDNTKNKFEELEDIETSINNIDKEKMRDIIKLSINTSLIFLGIRTENKKEDA